MLKGRGSRSLSYYDEIAIFVISYSGGKGQGDSMLILPIVFIFFLS
jgi:hypothetical protein